MTRHIFTLFIAASLASCTANFPEYNRNPNQATPEQMRRDNYNVGSRLLQLQNLVIPTQEHLYQFTESLAGQTYGGYMETTPDGWATRFSTFNPSIGWRKAPLYDLLSETYPPYRGIYKESDDELVLAWADLLRVAIMHRVTDQHGPIPYSKVVEGKGGELTVPYDSQQDVYAKMFDELDAATAVLTANASLSTDKYGVYDLVYYGDMAKWAMFANSLKLRMAMRLAYIEPETARAKAAEAIAAGVITKNVDNALFHTPLNRSAMIWNDWGDNRVSADIQSYMNGFEDPRREKMFTLFDIEVKQEPVGDEPAATEIKRLVRGMRIGSTPLSKKVAVANYSNFVIADTDPFLWMNAAEVAFLRAEYELRWGTAAGAKEFYEQGVKLSFEEPKAADVDKYLASTATPAAYIDMLSVIPPVVDGKIDDTAYPAYPHTLVSSVTPAWDEAAAEAGMLERIITQKWIAIYPLGNEAWAEYRRTGYPRLMPVLPEHNKSAGVVDSHYGARRLIYPNEEYNENRQNVEDAVAGELKGKDTAAARVWWDARPY